MSPLVTKQARLEGRDPWAGSLLGSARDRLVVGSPAFHKNPRDMSIWAGLLRRPDRAGCDMRKNQGSVVNLVFGSWVASVLLASGWIVTEAIPARLFYRNVLAPASTVHLALHWPEVNFDAAPESDGTGRPGAEPPQRQQGRTQEKDPAGIFLIARPLINHQFTEPAAVRSNPNVRNGGRLVGPQHEPRRSNALFEHLQDGGM